MNRYEKIKEKYNKLRNEIESLIDIEMKSHSTYTLQKKGIGSNTYKFLKDPDLRDRLGTETILRIYEKMIEGE